MPINFDNIPMKSSWRKALSKELSSQYMKDIENFLNSELNKGKNIFPKTEEIFSALNLLNLEDVKVVIIGQDPYHGEGQAHGLSFSVKKGVKIPPSLKNIYKELEDDLGHKISDHGYLEKWAKEGVLLLNAVLTVEEKKPGSHQKIGWQKFTDKIIKAVNEKQNHVVFVLWGSYAAKKAQDIDASRHLVIESVHPSPLSSYRGFFGSKPFSKANAFLEKNGKKAVDWSLPPLKKTLFD